MSVPRMALDGCTDQLSAMQWAWWDRLTGKRRATTTGELSGRSQGNTLPPAAPIGAIDPNKPTDRLRIRPGGNLIVNRAIAFG